MRTNPGRYYNRSSTHDPYPKEGVTRKRSLNYGYSNPNRYSNDPVSMNSALM